MRPLDQVRLRALMARGPGKPEIVVGLVDGGVALDHPDLVGQPVRLLGPAGETSSSSGTRQHGSGARRHGTFVAGMLAAGRSAATPGICPGCTLLVRPVAGVDAPPAAPSELATGLNEVIDAGARVVNLSLTLRELHAPHLRDPHRAHEGPGAADIGSPAALVDALDRAGSLGVVVVVAAGNEGLVGGGSVIVRHPYGIPVVAYDRRGRPLPSSNVGPGIGRRGLGAPGENIEGLGVTGPGADDCGTATMSGTSAAAPFVTGTVALLWSLFPRASAAEVRYAVTRPLVRRSVVPPLLDAAAARRALTALRATDSR
ncbi:S8 family peptidase [Streptomyces sp. NPDC088146]|uniref:S8 family peptidase n=1 Tax=Streptomyces sp. NPDC088146 TaxID=3365829 RepID=UPI003829DC93